LFNFFFKGLRGKLILTYTLVTVLALMALEVIILMCGVAFSRLGNQDQIEYVNDVITILSAGARSYMQTESGNYPGLQVWLENQYRSGYASLEPQYLYDSPAAKITAGSAIYIMTPERKVIAQYPTEGNDLRGKTFTFKDDNYANQLIQNGIKGKSRVNDLYTITKDKKYLVVVPVYQKDSDMPPLGVIVLTIEPMPYRELFDWLEIIAIIGITGVIMLFAVAPFGAIFGFIMSTGLTRRLKNLTQAADRYSLGDFQAMPVDRSQDEIGLLSVRMRNMAERIQNLMEDKQALAKMKERNRIAQELHDTVKQQNFATLMQVRAARNLLANNPAGAERSLMEAENLLKSSQQELGSMISELRPAALEGKGLAEALREYLAGWSVNACIPSSFQVNEARSLPIDIERTLYRVAQEALANVARHSRASAVTVQLEYQKQAVYMRISDNGVGFNPQAQTPGGFGLVSMHERLAEVHGSLTIQTHQENGTTIIAEIPTANEPK
jgi:NarL family two-component system sensor histidine kinase LiaS